MEGDRLKRIAQFEKVSPEQFSADMPAEPGVGDAYERVALPVRATGGSAGYDFVTPVFIKLMPGQTALIPTGIRCRMEEGWVLMIFPRSGLGFRNRMQLDNTVGIIDSDYYNAENEGHILIKITNDSRTGQILEIPAGKAFAQGVFLQFGITEDDICETERTGGFGSTGA